MCRLVHDLSDANHRLLEYDRGEFDLDNAPLTLAQSWDASSDWMFCSRPTLPRSFRVQGYQSYQPLLGEFPLERQFTPSTSTRSAME